MKNNSQNSSIKGNFVFISIIIAVKKLNDDLKECIRHCLNLDYPNYEIIVFPDAPFIFNHPKVKVIATGSISPPKKRDLALKEANGEILAFIDDDAYPDRNWLKNAVGFFQDDNIGSVCGPAVSAPGGTLKQRASGAVYESILGSGDQLFRFKPLAKRKTNDYPTCNLLVRFSVMRQLGGFNTRFWPGDDTFLCSGITEKLKKKIIYTPTVLVYHKRRPLFLPHLKQMTNYALHRGYFVKKGHKNSLKISYFLPSFLLLGIAGGALLSVIIPTLRVIYLSGVITYLFLVLVFSISKDLELILLKFSGIILTHFLYGFFFIKGFFSRKMKEENNEDNHSLPTA